MKSQLFLAGYLVKEAARLDQLRNFLARAEKLDPRLVKGINLSPQRIESAKDLRDMRAAMYRYPKMKAFNQNNLHGVRNAAADVPRQLPYADFNQLKREPVDAIYEARTGTMRQIPNLDDPTRYANPTAKLLADKLHRFRGLRKWDVMDAAHPAGSGPLAGVAEELPAVPQSPSMLTRMLQMLGKRG